MAANLRLAMVILALLSFVGGVYQGVELWQLIDSPSDSNGSLIQRLQRELALYSVVSAVVAGVMFLTYACILDLLIKLCRKVGVENLEIGGDAIHEGSRHTVGGPLLDKPNAPREGHDAGSPRTAKMGVVKRRTAYEELVQRANDRTAD